MDTLNFKTIRYNSAEAEILDSFDAQTAGTDGFVRWVDIGSIADRDGIERLGEALGIHRLIVEDILNPNQMVKLDHYDDCLFLVLKMIDYDNETCSINTEHVSLVLKKGVVVSIAENSGDIFRRVREKITQARDNVRRQGADYLCYELLDTVVDHYFEVIDQLGDATDSIEEELIADPVKSTLQRIYFVKRELMYL
ncbi:MAG: CorA family divalent cation transporter, partial [Clostridia bacterium]|nr:CorA family divalent cation transporter [Clostridia bacterium]